MNSFAELIKFQFWYKINLVFGALKSPLLSLLKVEFLPKTHRIQKRFHLFSICFNALKIWLKATHLNGGTRASNRPNHKKQYHKRKHEENRNCVKHSSHIRVEIQIRVFELCGMLVQSYSAAKKVCLWTSSEFKNQSNRWQIWWSCERHSQNNTPTFVDEFAVEKAEAEERDTFKRTDPFPLLLLLIIIRRSASSDAPSEGHFPRPPPLFAGGFISALKIIIFIRRFQCII